MKDIPGFEGRYAVTDDGRVWSHPKRTSTNGGRQHAGMWLKPQTSQSGYLYVDLKAGGRKLIHRLVLMAFVGAPPPDAPEGNHKNGVKKDNRAANLEWVSSSENRAHAWRTGLIKQTDGRRAAGFRRGKALRRLDDQAAADIRAQLAAGVTQTALAQQFGVSRKAIFLIKTNRTYQENA